MAALNVSGCVGSDVSTDIIFSWVESTLGGDASTLTRWRQKLPAASRLMADVRVEVQFDDRPTKPDLVTVERAIQRTCLADDSRSEEHVRCLLISSHKDAEAAARFYAETFPDSAVNAVHRAPSDYPSGKQGDVLTVEFTVAGIPCLGLNGGPAFKHNEAFSFQVATDDQQETDRYWNAIVGNGGQESACDQGGAARLISIDRRAFLRSTDKAEEAVKRRSA
jgi:predicted 3-demethylubiquinone-9 3-methyltransferase (glyoxalase superfamily)